MISQDRSNAGVTMKSWKIDTNCPLYKEHIEAGKDSVVEVTKIPKNKS
jgi:hypothetical protein